MKWILHEYYIHMNKRIQNYIKYIKNVFQQGILFDCTKNFLKYIYKEQRKSESIQN